MSLVSKGITINLAIIPSPTQQHVSQYIDDYNINEIGYENCDIQYVIVFGRRRDNCVLFDIKGITTKHYYLRMGRICSYKVENSCDLLPHSILCYFLKNYMGPQFYMFNRKRRVRINENLPSRTIFINYSVTCVDTHDTQCRYIVYMEDIPVAKLWAKSKKISPYSSPTFYVTPMAQKYNPGEEKGFSFSKTIYECCSGLIVWEECMKAIADTILN